MFLGLARTWQGRAGADGIHPNARRQGERQALRQRPKPRLGHGVGNKMRRQRPDPLIQHIHDQALRRFRQRLGEILRQHKGGAQIGFHMPIPGFARRVLPFIAFEGGGVVDQHTERPQRLGGVRDQLRDFRFLAEFCLQRNGAAAKGADIGGRCLGGIGAGGVVDGDIKAGFGKRKRHGAAKPLASARDQRGGGDV